MDNENDAIALATNDIGKKKSDLELWIKLQESKTGGSIRKIGTGDKPPATIGEFLFGVLPPNVAPKVMITPPGGGQAPAGTTLLATGTAYIDRISVPVIVYR